jgi:uncharacterized protein (DUF736 family)
LSREEAAQQRGKKLLQAVAGIRPGSAATASWGVIRHQKGHEVRRAVQHEGDDGSERRRSEDGVFAGTIKTLSLNVKARLVPADASTNDKAPDLRVLVGNVEIGAAWHRTSKENTEYHSVKLDDPSFPAPIYANLFKGETDYTLVWSR